MDVIWGENVLTSTNIKRMAPKPQLITSKNDKLTPSTAFLLWTLI